MPNWPTTDESATSTVVPVPTPRDSDASPYVTAIADIGSVSVTGQVRGVAPEAVEVEQPVSLGVEPADDQRVIVVNPS